MLKALVAIALLAALNSSCIGAGERPDLRATHAYLAPAVSIAGDLVIYSSAHPETVADVPFIDGVKKALEKLDADILLAIEQGRTTVDARELLSVLDIATMKLLEAPNPRVGQLAIGLRGALLAFRMMLDGKDPPPMTTPPVENTTPS